MVKMRDETYSQALRDLVDRTGLTDFEMAEVGSYAGESARVFCQTGKVKRIWCIDPWQPGYDSNDIASSSNFTEVEQAFDKVMEEHPTLMHKFKGTLQDFATRFPDIRPDLYYIDAEHTYEACRKDISSALKTMPKFIAGHDYCSTWSGVMKAVDEMLGKPDATFQDGSWLKKL